MYDLITRPLSKKLLDGISLGYSFYDFNAKINHKFSDKNRLYYSFYGGNDKIRAVYKNKDFPTDKATSSMAWGNILSGMRWNHIFNNKLFVNTVAYYSQYKFKTENYGNFEENEYYNIFYSGINDFSIKTDFEYFYNENYKLRFGTNSIYHSFYPDVKQFKQKQETEQSLKYTAFESAVYIDNELIISKNINAVIGFRLSDYIIENKHFLSYEPRIIFNIKLFNFLSIKPAYTLMQQNIHLLAGTSTGFTKAIWVPATIKAVPETAQQFSVSLASSLNTKMYELSIEVYDKKMNNLIAYKEGVSYFSGTSDWQDKIEIGGIGKSKGIEMMFQKTQGRISGWLAYTLSKTTRQFENINNGLVYPYKYDRRHNASISLTYKVNKRQTVSATWVYGTGNAITLPIAKYNAVNEDNSFQEDNQGFVFTEEVYIYPKRNSLRMKPYHRLDIGMNFFKIKKNTKRTFSVGIYNLYFRQNPYFYYLYNPPKYDNEGQVVGYKQAQIRQVSYFPFVPSISYSIDF